MEQNYIHEIARLAQLAGLLDELKYRDFCIKEEYEILRKEGLRLEQAEKILSEKYALSSDSIHKIVYK